MNKIRTDILVAMLGIKLNAQVIIKNIQNIHGKSPTPTGARRTRTSDGAAAAGWSIRTQWARLQGTQAASGRLGGPHVNGRTFRAPSGCGGVVDAFESRDGQ